MFMSQKRLWWTAKCQCSVCTIVLSFHLPTWYKRKMQGVNEKSVCVCVLGAVSMQCKRKMHVNWLKKCVCTCSSALVFTHCKRKKYVNGLKKCLFVHINFPVVESSNPLMLWSIQTKSHYPVWISILDSDSLGSDSVFVNAHP